jgi:hypothetical protein
MLLIADCVVNFDLTSRLLDIFAVSLTVVYPLERLSVV